MSDQSVCHRFVKLRTFASILTWLTLPFAVALLLSMAPGDSFPDPGTIHGTVIEVVPPRVCREPHDAAVCPFCLFREPTTQTEAQARWARVIQEHSGGWARHPG